MEFTFKENKKKFVEEWKEGDSTCVSCLAHFLFYSLIIQCSAAVLMLLLTFTKPLVPVTSKSFIPGRTP